MKLITSQREAAKFLGWDIRTVQRRIERGEFCKPISETKNKKGTSRAWSEEDLQRFKDSTAQLPTVTKLTQNIGSVGTLQEELDNVIAALIRFKAALSKHSD